MEVSIPDGGLGWRPAAAGIFVQQEAKYIQQEEDRDNVQIREKTLQKRLKFLIIIHGLSWTLQKRLKFLIIIHGLS